VDLVPAGVLAARFADCRYQSSEHTLYRLLAENAEARERRNPLRHPHYTARELLARRPNTLAGPRRSPIG
jgi:hypothetical protein